MESLNTFIYEYPYICNSIFKEQKMIFFRIYSDRMNVLKLDKIQDLEVKLWKQS